MVTLLTPVIKFYSFLAGGIWWGVDMDGVASARACDFGGSGGWVYFYVGHFSLFVGVWASDLRGVLKEKSFCV